MHLFYGLIKIPTICAILKYCQAKWIAVALKLHIELSSVNLLLESQNNSSFFSSFLFEQKKNVHFLRFDFELFVDILVKWFFSPIALLFRTFCFFFIKTIFFETASRKEDWLCLLLMKLFFQHKKEISKEKEKNSKKKFKLCLPKTSLLSIFDFFCFSFTRQLLDRRQWQFFLKPSHFLFLLVSLATQISREITGEKNSAAKKNSSGRKAFRGREREREKARK